MEVADGEALAPAMMVMGAWLEEGWPFKADLSVAYGAQSGTFSWRGLRVVPFPRLFLRIKRIRTYADSQNFSDEISMKNRSTHGNTI